MINIAFTLTYLEAYFILINITSFLLYGYDKLIAIQNNNISRISEKALLLTAFIGGIIGAILSMLLFRHKIKKLSFIVKFFIVVLLQRGIYFYFLSNRSF